MWSRTTGKHPALSANHTKEADELFEGRRHKDEADDTRPVPSANGAPAPSGAGSMANHPMSEAREKMAERGERLQELGGKFSSLADSSKNMVDMLKEYNEKQEKKKWWEL
ncbi:hypothetical protein BC829DRAFT_399064 [Chytridium lagenaria]|nr:hypothetical protein BC829DRAFT_399064 [Chytridium lagenaria]